MLKVMHRHEKLAPESVIEFMATVSGACVRALE